MAVNITKTKTTEPKSGVKIVGQTNALTEMADQFLVAEAKYQKLRKPFEAAKKERDAALTDMLIAVNHTTPEDQKVEVKGTTGRVELSEIPKVVEGQDANRLKEILGVDQFMHLAEIKIGTIRAILTESQQKEVLIELRKGSRRAKVLPK